MQFTTIILAALASVAIATPTGEGIIARGGGGSSSGGHGSGGSGSGGSGSGGSGSGGSGSGGSGSGGSGSGGSGSGGSGSGGSTTPYAPCAGLYGTAQCCATDVLGVADLNCASPTAVPTSAANFESICAAGGKTARCCVLPILGQSVLCATPIGISK